MTETGLIIICVTAAVVVLLPCTAAVASVCFLIRENLRLRQGIDKMAMAVTLSEQRHELSFAQVKARLDDIERSMAMSGVEPGVYTEVRDPVTGAISAQRQEDQKSWADLINANGNVSDILREMQTAVNRG